MRYLNTYIPTLYLLDHARPFFQKNMQNMQQFKERKTLIGHARCIKNNGSMVEFFKVDGHHYGK